jgi:hypothetical protein
MGHYDEYYDNHYAELRKQKQERYEKVMEKYIELKRVLAYNSSSSIDYHMDMIDALIKREMQ